MLTLISKTTGVLIIIMIVSLAASVVAFAWAPEERNLIIDYDQVVSNDIYTAGHRIVNNGVIEGDLFAAVSDLKSSGTVNGDIIAAADDINIEGSVDGNIRIACRNAYIQSNVSRNVNVFAENIRIRPGAVIQGSSVLFAGSTVLDGTIMGDVILAGDRISIRGTVEGSVKVLGAGNVIIGSNAVIKGDLFYDKGINMDIEEGASIIGSKNPVHFKNSIRDFNQVFIDIGDGIGRFFGIAGTMIKTIGFIGYLLLIILLALLLPKQMGDLGQNIEIRPWVCFFTGLAIVLLIPVISIVLMIFLIGIQSAVAVMAVYLMLLYLSSVPWAIWLGNLIGRHVFKTELQTIWALIIGTLFIKLILSIPTGGIVFFSMILFLFRAALLFFGTGAWMLMLKDLFKTMKAKEVI